MCKNAGTMELRTIEALFQGIDIRGKDFFIGMYNFSFDNKNQKVTN